MISLSKFLEDPSALQRTSHDEFNPLTEPDGLLECELVGFRFDVFRARTGLIFDLKNSLQLDPDSNTAVLIVHNSTIFKWTASSIRSRFISRVIVSSEPGGEEARHGLKIFCHPSAELHLQGDYIDFWHGHVHGMDEAPPDFGTGSIQEVNQGIQSWDSLIKLKGFSSSRRWNTAIG